MGDVSAAGVALIIIFIFILLAISVELAYVLWYRRRFKRAPPYSGGESESAAAESFGSPASKELLLYNVLSHGHGHGHQFRSERAPVMADNYYSFPPAVGYAWPGSSSPSPAPEKKMREKEEEREFEFAEVGLRDQPTPFYTPRSSPSRVKENQK